VVLQEVAQPGLPFHDRPVHWRGTNPRKGVAMWAHPAPNYADNVIAVVSAYHAHRNLRYGHRAEVPTYRHLRKAALPWHIDYCFMPAAWRTRLTRARVVEGEHWLTRSDHSPVAVEVAD
jgi:endonuclease/exonuclease/phosphatase family metal-dependent hydrolase